MAAQPSAATLETVLHALNKHEPDLTTLGPLGELQLERVLDDAKTASQACMSSDFIYGWGLADYLDVHGNAEMAVGELDAATKRANTAYALLERQRGALPAAGRARLAAAGETLQSLRESIDSFAGPVEELSQAIGAHDAAEEKADAIVRGVWGVGRGLAWRMETADRGLKRVVEDLVALQGELPRAAPGVWGGGRRGTRGKRTAKGKRSTVGKRTAKGKRSTVGIRRL